MLQGCKTNRPTIRKGSLCSTGLATESNQSNVVRLTIEILSHALSTLLTPCKRTVEAEVGIAHDWVVRPCRPSGAEPVNVSGLVVTCARIVFWEAGLWNVA